MPIKTSKRDCLSVSPARKQHSHHHTPGSHQANPAECGVSLESGCQASNLLTLFGRNALGCSGSKGHKDPGKLKYLITEQGQEGWQAYLRQLNLAPRAIHHNSGYLPSIFAELGVQPANQPYPKSKILNGRKQLETFLVLHSGVTKCEARQVHNWGTRT